MGDAYCFLIMQTFQLHILFLQSTFRMQYSLRDHARNNPANLCTSRRCSRLERFDACSLLAIDYSTFDLSVKASNISHESVGYGVFSGRPFVGGKTVGYYIGTLVY